MSSQSALSRLQDSVLPTKTIREIDRLAVEKYGMHSLVLMENAAVGCLRWFLETFPDPASVTVLCGRGNNGGDGLALARHLACYGWRCRVLLLGPVEQLAHDARINYHILTCEAGLPVELFLPSSSTATPESFDSSVIVDAMLGTGATGDPRTPLDDWIAAANRTDCTRVAVDIPTGVDAETGQCSPTTFRADATLTFVARKPAMQSEHNDVFGKLHVLPIGIPKQLIEEILARP